MTVSRSKQGFSTAIWGAMLWPVLHIIALNYSCSPTKQEQKDYYTFFKILAKILPCRACRCSTDKFYKSAPTRLTMQVFKSRTTLAMWVWRLHNRVNKRLDKRCSLSFPAMSRKYEGFRADCNAAKHGCETPAGKPKKRAVVVIMTVEQYKASKLKSSVVDVSRKQHRLKL